MRKPSYKTLNTFVQIINTGSLINAAKRLNISPSAVSHQLKSLEETLELTLTLRSGNTLVLTKDGQRLFEGVADAFSKIDQTLAQIQPDKSNILKITTPPSFYASWLAPRLTKFLTLHPNIDITISGTSRKQDLNKGEWDLAIRWMPSFDSALSLQSHELLWQECLGCIASPQLAENKQATDIELVTTSSVIHASAFPDHWSIWAKQMPQSMASPSSESVVDSRSNVLKTVSDGLGIAVVDIMLASTQLEEGLLLEPNSNRVQLKSAYWVLSSPIKQESTQCRLFKSWLRDEIRLARQKLGL